MNNIIFFDGVCNLCNFFVQFIIERDKKNVFKFSSLQSAFAEKLLSQHNINYSDLETVILYENEKLYTESTAALKILKKLNSGMSFFYMFIIIPKFLRDPVYRYIARNRYRWFGKKDSCMMPSPELKDKFIE